jgi:hypothetical protein
MIQEDGMAFLKIHEALGETTIETGSNERKGKHPRDVHQCEGRLRSINSQRMVCCVGRSMDGALRLCAEASSHIERLQADAGVSADTVVDIDVDVGIDVDKEVVDPSCNLCL